MKLDRRQRQLALLYAISIVYGIYMLWSAGALTSSDSESYFRAYTSLMSGEIDATRTPVYPFFVGTLQQLGCSLWGIALMQYVIFNISVYFFYSLANQLIYNDKIASIATLVYILSPQTAQWSSLMLSESLSISLIVIWLYYTLRVITDQCRWTDVSAYSLLLLVLLMLRPSHVYLIAGSALLCLYYIRQRKNAAKIIAATVIPCIALVVYSIAFYNQYGIFTPTRVTDINNAIMMKLNYENINTDCIDDPALRADWDYYLTEDSALYDGYTTLQNKYGIHSMHQTVKSLESHNRMSNLKHILVRTQWMINEHQTLHHQPTVTANALLVFLTLTGKEVTCLTLVYLIFVVWAYRRGGWPKMSAMMALMIISAIALSVVGAQSDYLRLNVGIIPMLILGMGQIAGDIRMIYHKTL